MANNITVTFYDTDTDVTYNINQKISITKTRQMSRFIKSTQDIKAPCLQEIYIHMLSDTNAAVIGSFGKTLRAPCNCVAHGNINALRPTDKMRACLGRMSRGLCQDPIAIKNIAMVFWPESYNKQR